MVNWGLLGLLLGSDSTALGVRTLGKVNKQVGEREEVSDVDPDSHLSTGGTDASGNKEVRDSDGDANKELSDLHRGQVLLARGVQSDRGRGVVSVHDRVNKRVEDDKDPDRGSLIVGTGLHGDHGSSMVVGLKEGRTTALDNDDDGINDLVELGEVEDVSPVTERAVPERLVSVAVLERKGRYDKKGGGC